MAVSYSGLTVVSGTTITATWGNMVRDAGVVPYASSSARTTAVTSPTEGMPSWLSDRDSLDVYDGSAHSLIAGKMLYIDKDDDETVSVTGLQDDDDLVLPVLANCKYLLSAQLFVTSSWAGYDISVGFTMPSGAALDIGGIGGYLGDYTSAATHGDVEIDSRLAESSPTTPIVYATSDTGAHINLFISGRLVMSSTAGNFQLRWAPYVAGSVTVKEGSWMRLELVGDA